MLLGCESRSAIATATVGTLVVRLAIHPLIYDDEKYDSRFFIEMIVSTFVTFVVTTLAWVIFRYIARLQADVVNISSERDNIIEYAPAGC